MSSIIINGATWDAFTCQSCGETFPGYRESHYSAGDCVFCIGGDDLDEQLMVENLFKDLPDNEEDGYWFRTY